MNALLVLIDLQNDYLSDSQIQPPPDQIVSEAARLLESFRRLGFPVVHVRTEIDPRTDDRMPHWRERGLWRCVRGSSGWLPPSVLEEADDEPVITKTFFSAFAGGHLTNLIEEKEIDTLVIGGVHVHGCIRQTIMDAYERGLESIVVPEAVGGYDPIHAAVTRQYLEGRGARFVATEELFTRLRAGLETARRRESPPSYVHRSPRDPQETWEVPETEAESVRAFAASAKAMQPIWYSVEMQERTAILTAAAEILSSRESTLSDMMAREVGKPISMCKKEIDATVDALHALVARFAPERPWTRADGGRRRPHGVVAAVTPWNNPIYIPVGKIAPAILFGNTMVWKPSPASHRCALMLRTILRDAGLPDDVLQLVSGDGTAARHLMQDKSVDAVTFTGSSAAGYDAQVISARRRIPLQAELGGNNAAVVWPDTEMDVAVSEIAFAAFGYAGQRCTANRRAVVHQSILPAFLDALTNYARTLPLGDPLDENTLIGPVISEAKAGSIESLLERAAHSGAVIERIAPSRPLDASISSAAYCAPAIVICNAMQSEVVQEETFGPVLVIQEAADWEHAIQLTNGVRQGLVASLFSSNDELWSRFKGQAHAGILKRNQGTAGARVDRPFGGWKASGIGPPEHGDADVDFYTKVQTVYE